MTVAAGSFTGRVLAVFSRRSPGFRPGRSGVAPAGPVPSSSDQPEISRGMVFRVSMGELTRAAAGLQSMPPLARLQLRGALHEHADLLKSAHRRADVLANALTDYARPLVGHDLVLISAALDSARVHALALARAYEHAVSNAHIFDDGGARTRRAIVELVSLDLDRADDLARELAQYLIGDLGLDLELDVARDPDLDRERYRTQVSTPLADPDLARFLARALADARAGSAAAADNFTGADISALDLDRINLGWVRWDESTRWPSRDWADRIRRGSVEYPPGSGIFTVLPAREQEPADVNLV